MAKKKKKKAPKSNILSEVRAHYDEAKAELTMRASHKSQGFDEYDNLYRSYIDSAKWPYNSKIFIPLTFKSIYGKDTRLVTGKVKGKLVAGEYGNELGARIGSELLSAQYDDHDEYFEEPLMSKFFRLSQNARKYGAGFGLVAWRQEKRNGDISFDGPVFEVLDNRKVYLQPGAVSISTSDYVIVEREATLEELETINDVSEAKGSGPAYKNLEKLRALEENKIKREIQSRNLAIRNLEEDRSGKGKHKPFRLLTEYRRDKWITWCPDVGGDDNDSLGVVLRVIDNPYSHGLIPLVRLVYVPIDDDMYGVSEIEPGRSAQKAVNALASGFIEAVSTELYPIIKGHPTNVDWKTIEFKPRAAWIMNNPATDLVRQEGALTFTRNFVEAYRLLVTTFSESMGDTAADASNLAALATEKTATEIKDLALQRGSRDNLNKIFLSAAITKVYQMWWSMNQDFMTDTKVIRIAGKDALEYFVGEGLDGWTLTSDGFELINLYMQEVASQGLPITFEEVYETLREAGELDEFAIPMFPVSLSGEELPKLRMESDEKSGFLSIEQDDLAGQYRFVVDLNTLGMPNEKEEVSAINLLVERAMALKEDLAAQGVRVKYKELLETMADKLNLKNADQYFEKLPESEMQSQLPAGMQAGMPGQEQAPGAPQQMPEQPIAPQDIMGGINGGQI